MIKNSVNMTRNRTGFTIVELLIVVVVIGILAAITIVAYNGIQNKANNAKTETTVSDYRKLLISYATINGQYPLGGGAGACLGEVYSYSAGSCMDGSPRTDFNDALRANLKTGTLPSPYTGCLKMYGYCRYGASYSPQEINLDGASHTWSISYLLIGDVRCTAEGQVGGSWVNATTALNSAGYIEQTSGTTLCRVVLPNPAKL